MGRLVSGGNRDGAREARGTPLKRAPCLGKWPDPSSTVTSPPFCESVLVASRRGRITDHPPDEWYTPRGRGLGRKLLENQPAALDAAPNRQLGRSHACSAHAARRPF